MQIFGPVLVALPFRTAKEAIALGNNTNYGLGGSVWTENVSLALEVAMSIKAGTIWVNAHNMFDAAAGFGGYKHSGYGRDGGKEVCYLRRFLHVFSFSQESWKDNLLEILYVCVYKFVSLRASSHSELYQSKLNS